MRGNSGLLMMLIVLFICWLADETLAQRAAYSLQAAVDELHRREAAKYPLNAPPSTQQLQSPHYFGSALGSQDYWDDDTDLPSNKNRNRHRLNKALAKYLERENYDDDHDGLSIGPFGGYEFDDDNNNLFEMEKKRASLFRERDHTYDNSGSSVFRERETPPPNGAEHAELAEQFLREIEEAQEHERQERYKEALRHLWEKYQQQENEIDDTLFEEKKRMRMPPYYMLMQKKSSYPVLPWLPYNEKKKRFPVAKRSAVKRSPAESYGKTDEKVERELSELFGTSTDDEKKKRSTDAQTKVSTTHQPETTATTELTSVKNKNATTKAPNMSPTQHEQHAGHATHEHKHRKRSDHAHGRSHEENYEESDEEGHDEHGEHDAHEEEEEGSEEEEHDEFDEEDEQEQNKKKKKRDIDTKHTTGEVVKNVGQRSNPLDFLKKRDKKSIDWSNYFGLDRKKKAMGNNVAEVKKRSANDDDESYDVAEEKKKRNMDPEKLENMNKKLQSIEDFIIDETIKYTGAHEGIANQDEIRQLKDHVLSRLATAYSLEKMRRALEKLRQSVENENHLLRNVIDPGSEEAQFLETQNHLSAKKQKGPTNNVAPSDLKAKEIHSNAMMSTATGMHNPKNGDANQNNGNADDMKKKQKKRNSYLRYPELPNDIDEESAAGHYEAFNDAYLGNKNYMIGSNQCPLIESMAERCRGVDLLSGDLNQELLPICGVHQICYLCGTSQVNCDYQYLSEADTICGNNNDCEAAARSVLMILRGTAGPQLGPRECLKNPCLYSAMREIGL